MIAAAENNCPLVFTCKIFTCTILPRMIADFLVNRLIDLFACLVRIGLSVRICVRSVWRFTMERTTWNELPMTFVLRWALRAPPQHDRIVRRVPIVTRNGSFTRATWIIHLTGFCSWRVFCVYVFAHIYLHNIIYIYVFACVYWHAPFYKEAFIYLFIYLPVPIYTSTFIYKRVFVYVCPHLHGTNYVQG